MVKIESAFYWSNYWTSNGGALETLSECRSGSNGKFVNTQALKIGKCELVLDLLGESGSRKEIEIRGRGRRRQRIEETIERRRRMRETPAKRLLRETPVSDSCKTHTQDTAE